MTNNNFKEFVERAAEHFESNGVEAIPQDLPVNYYPVLFSPYLRQEAAFDAMVDYGLTPNRISGLQLLAVKALKFAVKDCELKERQRIRLADRLNNPIH